MNKAKAAAGRFAQGAAWMQITFILSKLVGFATTAVLARLIVPEEYGLFTFGLLVVTMLEAIGEMGAASAAIWREKDPARTASAALALTLLFSACLFVAVLLAAPAIAGIAHKSEATGMVQALAATYLVTGPGAVLAGLLQRRLAFARVALVEVAKAAVKAGVSISLAYAGWGAWGLVAGHVASLAVGLLLLLLQTDTAGFARPDRASFDAVFRYGHRMAMVNLLGQVLKNSDYIVIALLLDPAALGLYVMGFSLVDQIVMSVCWAAAQTFLPILSRLQNDPDEFQAAFRSGLGLVLTLTVPASVGIVLVADVFIAALLGPNWLGAVPVVQAIGLYALFYSLAFNVGDVFKAIGKPHLVAAISVLNIAVALPLLAYCTRYGPAGVAIGQVAIAALMVVVYWTCAYRFARLSPRILWDAARTPVLAAAAMAAACIAVRQAASGLSPVLVLVLAALTGAVVYGGAVLLLSPALARQVAGFLGAKAEARP